MGDSPSNFVPALYSFTDCSQYLHWTVKSCISTLGYNKQYFHIFMLSYHSNTESRVPAKSLLIDGPNASISPQCIIHMMP